MIHCIICGFICKEQNFKEFHEIIAGPEIVLFQLFLNSAGKKGQRFDAWDSTGNRIKQHSSHTVPIGGFRGACPAHAPLRVQILSF